MIKLCWSRCLVAMVTVVAAGIVTAPPAAAHTISGVAPSDYESVLLGPTPAVPGINVRLRDLGRRVEVANTTNLDLVISGYDGEPYLRVGPTGVYENTRSPTLYKNKITTPGAPVKIPPQATANGPPSWHRVSGRHVVRWHDQRTRHEGGTPPAVRAAPHQPRILATWNIPMEWGGTQLVANGIIRWAPPPDPLPWAVPAAILAAAIVIASRSSRWGSVLAAGIAAGVAVDVVHALVAVIPASDSLPQAAVKFLIGGFVSVIAWAAGGAAAVLLQRENADGLFLAVFAALMLLLTGGLGDLTVLTRSQVPYAVAPVVGRMFVSATIGLSAGVLLGGIRALRRRGAEASGPKSP